MAETAGVPEAIILCIGEEVLRGEVVNTNAAWLANELSALGFRVREHRVVADRPEEIVAALRETLGAAPLVVATGGLGPTGDDLTAAAAARFAGLELVESGEVLEAIARRLNRPVAELSPGARQMARVPAGAEALPNPRGSAPGIYVSCQLSVAGCRHGGAAGDRRHLFLLPGVPHEMKAIFTESVAPRVEKLFPGRRRVLSRFWQIASWPESEADAAARKALGELLGPGRLELGTALGRGWVTLRATGAEEKVSDTLTTRVSDTFSPLLAEAHRRISERFGDSLWSTDKDDTLEAAAARELLARGLKVALAESCTGGLVAARLVGVPGISASLLEALVTYSDESKVRLLGVPEEVLAQHGAVSRECAEAMATGLRAQSGADITLSVTGIAGPEGGTPGKPVGTVHFALAAESGLAGDVRRLGGSRDWIRERAAGHGLWLLWRAARQLGGKCSTA